MISGGFRDGAIAPPFEKISSIFPSKNEKQFHTTSNASQKVFFAYDRTPSLFQNPRFVIDYDLSTVRSVIDMIPHLID
jgi:hypothetical protein